MGSLKGTPALPNWAMRQTTAAISVCGRPTARCLAAAAEPWCSGRRASIDPTEASDGHLACVDVIDQRIREVTRPFDALLYDCCLRRVCSDMSGKVIKAPLRESGSPDMDGRQWAAAW